VRQDQPHPPEQAWVQAAYPGGWGDGVGEIDICSLALAMFALRASLGLRPSFASLLLDLRSSLGLRPLLACCMPENIDK
ncbi:MAG: hypothetical protein KDH84_17890, partial [Calditrichaeota bacterium]|nr:hypothetical protein [Calditrichota bacterium]